MKAGCKVVQHQGTDVLELYVRQDNSEGVTRWDPKCGLPAGFRADGHSLIPVDGSVEKSSKEQRQLLDHQGPKWVEQKGLEVI